MKPKTLRAALNQIQDMLDGQEYSAADGSGHWDINGDSIKFVPQSGTNNYEG